MTRYGIPVATQFQSSTSMVALFKDYFLFPIAKNSGKFAYSSLKLGRYVQCTGAMEARWAETYFGSRTDVT